MTRLLFAVFSAAALGACGGSSHSADPAPPANPCGGDNPCAANPCGGANPCVGDNPCAGNPCAGGDGAASDDFSDWASWTRVSDVTFMSRGHQKKPANVFTRAEHADWYRALAEGTRPAPVGFQVVKAHYPDMSASKVAMVMVMTKMPAGYDPEHGDWFYGIYDPSGTRAMKAGKLEMCIDCHDSYDDTDYLGGLPR